MKNDFDYISDSSKKYMKAIEELSWKPIVYAADLADYLGVSESSVLTALDELKAEGQITIDPTGRISLTNAKRKVKAGVTKSDEVLMGIPEKKASFEEADTVLTSSGDEHYDNGLETEKTEDSTYTSKTDGVFFDTADKKADDFARFAGLFSVLSIEKDGAESESIKMTEYTAETEQDTESTNEQLGRNGNATEEEKEHEEITSAEIPASSGGYEEQIITDVLYKPGEEPEPIQRRLKILFEKLDAAYPDKIVTYLYRDHSWLGEKVTNLYRKLGYPDGNTFLAAYGYTVKHGQSGAPKTIDASGIIEELRLRYKDGPTCSSMDELKAENPDIAPKFKSLQNKSKELFGMPFLSFLVKEGIMKSKHEYAGGLELLKERYADSPFEGNEFVLFSQNPDINWNEVKKAAEDADMVLGKYLLSEGILKSRYAGGLELLRERYADNPFKGTYNKLTTENPDIDWHQIRVEATKKGITPRKFLSQEGLLIAESSSVGTAESKLNYIMEQLKTRYVDKGQKEDTLKELKENNPDLHIGQIGSYLKKLGIDKGTKDYLVRNEIVYDYEYELEKFREKRKQYRSLAESEADAIELPIIRYKDGPGNAPASKIREFLIEYIMDWHAYSLEPKEESAEQAGYQKRRIKSEQLGSLKHYIKSRNAEAIAYALDVDELTNWLESQLHGNDYVFFVIPYALYAKEESIKKTIEELVDNETGCLKSGDWAHNVSNALYLSNTITAAEFMDDCPDMSLKVYASMRYRDEMEYRDTVMLRDFGFDTNGIRLFDLGTCYVKAKISSDLELLACCSSNIGGSTDFPENIGDPELNALCAAEFNKLKKDIEKFYMKRIKLIKQAYDEGTYISSSAFEKGYCRHPLLRKLAEKVIWKSRWSHGIANGYELDLFALHKGHLVNTAGGDYGSPSEATPVHLSGRSPKEVEKWESFISRNNIKLLIDQYKTESIL